MPKKTSDTNMQANTLVREKVVLCVHGLKPTTTRIKLCDGFSRVKMYISSTLSQESSPPGTRALARQREAHLKMASERARRQGPEALKRKGDGRSRRDAI